MTVGVLGLVPVGAGLAGMIEGAAMAGAIPRVIPGGGIDSHVRYLSGLLLAVGLGFWSTVPRLEQQGARFRLLTAIVVTGGLGRLLGIVLHGWPPPPMLFGLAMELVVTPSLCAWQGSMAARARRAGDGLTG